MITTFADYWNLSAAERASRKQELEHLARIGPSGGLNYEAHQAPLAYALLAPLDWLWRDVPVSSRVWRLRLICGLAAVVATTLLLFRLGDRLGLRPESQAAAAFVLLSSQMFYATVAHVANDWLAIPLMVLLMERLIVLEPRNSAALAFVFAAALLTKAYFLALVPVVFCVAIWRLPFRRVLLVLTIVAGCAGPWYLRNVVLFRNLSGMQETAGGTDWRGLLQAAFHLPWLRSIRQEIFTILWSGNQSFRAFSMLTLSLLIAGFLAGWLLYVRRTPPVAERILLIAAALWVAALAYTTVLAYFASHREAFTASPWFGQPLLPILLLVLWSGLDRQPAAGRLIGVWILGLSAYIITATHWIKLIPMYAGDEDRATFHRLFTWYRDARLSELLSPTAIRGAAFVFTAAVLADVASLALAAVLIHIATQSSDPRASHDARE